jgi:hypothetical protein
VREHVGSWFATPYWRLWSSLSAWWRSWPRAPATTKASPIGAPARSALMHTCLFRRVSRIRNPPGQVRGIFRIDLAAEQELGQHLGYVSVASPRAAACACRTNGCSPYTVHGTASFR